jgi:ATP-dependent helicase/nuclease subunit A
MRWTDKQLQTIEHRGKNILVSAAAGSGKTAVLTERIRHIVAEDRVPLSELLVVTFTEAAAAEMLRRITTALEESLAAASGERVFLEDQIRKIGAARIMTFHSFALSVLKQHFHAIGLDPSFKVADEQRAASLKEEAMETLFAENFRGQDPAFIDFCKHYAGVKNENAARAMVEETYRFIRSMPDPFGWLERSVSMLSADGAFMKMPAMEYAQEEIGYQIRQAKDIVMGVARFLDAQGFYGLLAKGYEDLGQVEAVERTFLTGGYDAIRGALDAARFATFRANKEDAANGWADYKGIVKMSRDRAKKILRELKNTFFARSLAEYEEEIRHVAPFARTLQNLVLCFHETYAELKRREGVVDFDDFEHMALAILEDDRIAEDYRKNIRYIFIDEYQDSNDVQEALIARIRRPGSVFMVGDVKQSIYSFRNAEPRLFLEKYNHFPHVDEEGAQDICIDLSSNFRSKRGIVNAVNTVFEQLMEPHYSGMAYDENARLRAGVENEAQWDRKVCVHLLDKAQGEDADAGATASSGPAGAANALLPGFAGARANMPLPETSGELVSEAGREAELAARIIQETVGQPFFDTKLGRGRAYEYRDIALLLRDAKTDAEIICKVLESRGIPAVTDRGEGYFETIEIDTFLGLLRVVDNLRQDVPLVAAMYSVVFSFELSDLAAIRIVKKEGCFYSAFLAYAESGPQEALREKCRQMTARIARWRREERFMRLDEFLWKLMRESGYYDYAGSLVRGEQRQANLRALLDRASDFQSGRVRGLYSFLVWMDEMRARVRVPQARPAPDGENAVRILTIHKSKGLEFPMVIQCRMGKSFARGGRQGKAMLHRDVGLVLDWEDCATHTYKKTLLHAVIGQRGKMDKWAEETRLLYVGMTRAMDRLHLIGMVPEPEALADLYRDAIPDEDIDFQGTTNYLGLILPVACARRDCFDIEVLPAGDADAGALEGVSAGRGGGEASDHWDNSGSGGEPVVSRDEDEDFLHARKRAFAERYGLENVRDGVDFQAQTAPDRAEPWTDEDAPGSLAARGGMDSLAAAPQGRPNSRAGAARALLREMFAAGRANPLFDARFDYCYPYESASRLKSKYSVTALASGSDDLPRYFTAGSAAESEEDAGLSAAERGTALHRVFELLDFSEAYARRDDAEWFETWLLGLREREILTAAEAESIGARPLRLFAGSELCRRAAAAELCIKEAPFNMKTEHEGAEIVVQGVIDCLFREADGWVVADYKSGRFAPGRMGEETRVREAYGGQIRLYRQAAERIFEEPVKETLVYMTGAGSCVVMDRE